MSQGCLLITVRVSGDGWIFPSKNGHGRLAAAVSPCFPTLTLGSPCGTPSRILPSEIHPSCDVMDSSGTTPISGIPIPSPSDLLVPQPSDHLQLPHNRAGFPFPKKNAQRLSSARSRERIGFEERECAATPMKRHIGIVSEDFGLWLRKAQNRMLLSGLRSFWVVCKPL